MPTILDKRGWVLTNIEWLMLEMIFHKENRPFFNKEVKISVWKLDDSKGEALII